MFFVANNKAFAIFSIMFGFSFFIQMDRSSRKGSDFNRFFAWRMVILLVFGYLNAMVFRADILTKYAIMGLVLLLLYRVDIKILVVLTILLLLQLPDIYQVYKSMTDSLYVLPEHSNVQLWEEIMVVSTTGSFAEVVKINAVQAFLEIWKLNFTSGRIYKILGFFLIGLLLGKSRLLENIESQRKWFYIIITIGGVLYLSIRQIRKFVEQDGGLNESTISLIQKLLTTYMDFFMVTIILSVFILLYQIRLFTPLLKLLSPYGKMSLTMYVTQSFLGVFLFYGFGLGLYDHLGPFLSLVTGFLILCVLLVAGHFWFRYFRYGPLEWLWRSLAYRSADVPFRK